MYMHKIFVPMEIVRYNIYKFVGVNKHFLARSYIMLCKRKKIELKYDFLFHTVTEGMVLKITMTLLAVSI
jgi:hypothetical protein